MEFKGSGIAIGLLMGGGLGEAEKQVSRGGRVGQSHTQTKSIRRKGYRALSVWRYDV